MIVDINRDKCCYCGCCVATCYVGAIDLEETIIRIDNTCTGCGICTKICPVGALTLN